MGRRVTRITAANADSLLPPCADCTFWGHPRPQDRHGVFAYDDERVVGHLLWATPADRLSLPAIASAPVTPNAALLLTVFVEEDHRGGGLAKMLVQAMAADLVKDGRYTAVEAVAARSRAPECVPRESFLAAVGFKVQREHPAYPRMRMDLRTTLTWRDVRDRMPRRLPKLVTRPAPVAERGSRNAEGAETLR